MLTPILRRARLALPMLSATILLSLASSPSPAQAPASLAAKRAPGHVVETITPAATVVSTAHYQALLNLTCNGAQMCFGDFPSVASKRRLNLTRMSCYMGSATYAEFATGQIDLLATDGSGSLVQFLPADYSTTWGHHVLNRAIEVQVNARQRIKVFLFLAAGSGVANQASCTAHGTLETLQ